MKNYELFLTCPKGLEQICKTEISEFIDSEISTLNGGLSFTGNIADLYKINLIVRTGMFLLVKVIDFNFKNIEQLYKKTFDFDWNTILNHKLTISINSSVIGENSIINNTQYANLKIKDAICDKIKTIKYKRPFVDKENPMINLRAVFNKEKCIIYLNSSGNPLYKRNYKNNTHEASINESLASGLIKMSDWNKTDILLDPMCGLGTIPMEACMMKRSIPPGINRFFSFQNWLNYDIDLFNSIKKSLLRKINQEIKSNIFGTDLNADYINMCKQNMQKFDYSLGIKFQIKNIINHDVSKRYHIVTNPPYEVRIGNQKELSIILKGLKTFLSFGCAVYVIYPLESDFIKNNFNYNKITEIYNGPIKCGFYKLANT